MVALTRPCLICKFCPYSDFLRNMYPSPKFNSDVCVLDNEFCCPVIVWGDDDPISLSDTPENTSELTLQTILDEIKDVKVAENRFKILSEKLSVDYANFIKTEKGRKIHEDAWRNLRFK